LIELQQLLLKVFIVTPLGIIIIIEFDVVKDKTKWAGVAYQPYPFTFEITKRKGTAIEGNALALW
jgi:hypothetical protein